MANTEQSADDDVDDPGAPLLERLRSVQGNDNIVLYAVSRDGSTKHKLGKIHGLPYESNGCTRLKVGGTSSDWKYEIVLLNDTAMYVLNVREGRRLVNDATIQIQTIGDDASEHADNE